ncbi:hypothetical protein [Microcoleus sp. FACHB-1515]|nr:hypothetical protein [Microcoleus sp. FACHB-1515]
MLDLIEQIPAEKVVLADTLAALAADYRFNDIFNLITVTAQT